MTLGIGYRGEAGGDVGGAEGGAYRSENTKCALTDEIPLSLSSLLTTASPMRLRQYVAYWCKHIGDAAVSRRDVVFVSSRYRAVLFGFDCI